MRVRVRVRIRVRVRASVCESRLTGQVANRLASTPPGANAAALTRLRNVCIRVRVGEAERQRGREAERQREVEI